MPLCLSSGSTLLAYVPNKNLLGKGTELCFSWCTVILLCMDKVCQKQRCLTTIIGKPVGDSMECGVQVINRHYKNRNVLVGTHIQIYTQAHIQIYIRYSGVRILSMSCPGCMARLVGSMHRRVASSIPGQGMCLGCGFHP